MTERVTITGAFMMHFNRHGAAPLVWSIAPLVREGAASVPVFEIAVREVSFHGVLVETVYRPKSTPDDEDGKPSAWLECSGTVRVFEDGRAEVGP